MKTKFRVAIIIMLAAGYVQLYPAGPIDGTNLRNHVEYLASDSLAGREPGTPGDRAAAGYIRNIMKQQGLKMLFEDGYQSLRIETGVVPGKGDKLEFDGFKGVVARDFLPLAFSAHKAVIKAPVVFAGWGFSIKTQLIDWNDYENLDVEGKWVMVLKGAPQSKNKNINYDEYSTTRSKARVAKEKKAAGIIFVSGSKTEPEDVLSPITAEDFRFGEEIPAIQITRATAERLLRKNGITVREIEALLDSAQKYCSFETGITATIATSLKTKGVRTHNVVGLLEGTDKKLKDEYIVVGAHYDHLGMGGAGSRMPDTVAVHNGADDNASGTATMLELIDYFWGHRPKRSIIFAAFTGEELGTLGSREFVSSPPVDLKKIKFMVNFDMIGRIDPEAKILTITGTGTAKGLDSIVRVCGEKSGLSLALRPEGIGPSDQVSFYIKDIPVLNFFGKAHLDYHTPFDDTDKINYPGLELVARFAAVLVETIAGTDKPLEFCESGPKKAPEGAGHGGLKASLGIMPDFSAVGIAGVRVEAVNPTKPAASAGMQKGDIIVAIDGKSVSDLYEYTARMKKYSRGDRISVDIIRNGVKEVLIVDL